MKKTALLLLVSSLAAPLPVHAEDLYIGTITSTGASVNNATTSAPFTISFSFALAVQCDAAAYVLAGTTGSAFSVSSSTGEKVAADQWWPLGAKNGRVNSIAVISVSGTANCRVFKLYDPVG